MGRDDRVRRHSSPRRLELPELGDIKLDGVVLANALHFVRDADVVLSRLAGSIKPGGMVVIIEYDRRVASQWVPYPIPLARLPMLAQAAGLSTPEVTTTRPSAQPNRDTGASCIWSSRLAGWRPAWCGITRYCVR